MKRSSRGYRTALPALPALLALLLCRVLALPAQAAAPANDNFAQAQVLSGLEGKVTGTTVDATTEGGEPTDNRAASLWFRWTAPFSGFTTFTTYGSSFNTVLGVYTGTTVNSLAEVVANDNAGNVEQSSVTFYAQAGTPYNVQVSSHVLYGEYTDGNVVLNWVLTPAPSNDNFARSTPIAGSSGRIKTTNVSATTEAGEPGADRRSASIWFRYAARVSGTTTFTTYGSDFNTVLAIETGTTVEDLQEIVVNDDEGGVAQSSVTFDAVEGTTYSIQVSSYTLYGDYETGNVILNWTAPGPQTYSLSGRITKANSAGLQVGVFGAKVTLGNLVALTDPSGYYFFSGLAPGSYAVAATAPGFVLTPSFRSPVSVSTNLADLNFRAAPGTVQPPATGTYSITGRVTDGVGRPLAGVTIARSGGASVVSNAAGVYLFAGVGAGSYVLTPSKAGYEFNPLSATVVVRRYNVVNINFYGVATAASAGFSIAGRVVDAATNLPLGGITVARTGGQSVVTNAQGVFQFVGVAPGSYTLSLSRAGYTFSPATLAVTVRATSLSGINIRTTASATARLSRGPGRHLLR